jgi:hypothetical protein
MHSFHKRTPCRHESRQGLRKIQRRCKRGLDYNDMPLVRSLARNAAKDNYKFSSLIMGVVQSPTFTMNMKSAVLASRGE